MSSLSFERASTNASRTLAYRAAFTDGRSLADPLLLVEILSPSNEAKTRVNEWAYATIPSVRERC